ncbi:MAG TPA: hypothetical protein PKU97_22260 [Kofleriaceae bacterium]|nr:hypothetical protein [Kofleriaceae bacterium]
MTPLARPLGLALSSLLVVAAPAAAGPYLGLGVGTAPALGEQMQTFAPASRSGRLELGQRLGPLAIEGAVGGFELVTARAQEVRSVSLSGGGKLFFNLQGQLDAFLRGGVERTWITAAADASGYSGDGVYLGGGAELRLALPVGATSLWIDYSRHQSTLRSGTAELEASLGMWTVGLSVGL